MPPPSKEELMGQHQQNIAEGMQNDPQPEFDLASIDWSSVDLGGNWGMMDTGVSLVPDIIIPNPLGVTTQAAKDYDFWGVTINNQMYLFAFSLDGISQPTYDYEGFGKRSISLGADWQRTYDMNFIANFLHQVVDKGEGDELRGRWANTNSYENYQMQQVGVTVDGNVITRSYFSAAQPTNNPLFFTPVDSSYHRSEIMEKIGRTSFQLQEMANEAAQEAAAAQAAQEAAAAQAAQEAAAAQAAQEAAAAQAAQEAAAAQAALEAQAQALAEELAAQQALIDAAQAAQEAAAAAAAAQDAEEAEAAAQAAAEAAAAAEEAAAQAAEEAAQEAAAAQAAQEAAAQEAAEAEAAAQAAAEAAAAAEDALTDVVSGLGDKPSKDDPIKVEADDEWLEDLVATSTSNDEVFSTTQAEGGDDEVFSEPEIEIIDNGGVVVTLSVDDWDSGSHWADNLTDLVDDEDLEGTVLEGLSDSIPTITDGDPVKDEDDKPVDSDVTQSYLDQQSDNNEDVEGKKNYNTYIYIALGVLSLYVLSTLNKK